MLELLIGAAAIYGERKSGCVGNYIDASWVQPGDLQPCVCRYNCEIYIYKYIYSRIYI